MTLEPGSPYYEDDYETADQMEAQADHYRGRSHEEMQAGIRQGPMLANDNRPSSPTYGQKLHVNLGELDKQNIDYYTNAHDFLAQRAQHKRVLSQWQFPPGTMN